MTTLIQITILITYEADLDYRTDIDQYIYLISAFFSLVK
ncbi:short chain dehydrogenase [Pedobacter sp. BAL39]|nr:short chain dehydrogenase [Pedobacter sp. BAL39]